MEALGRGGAGHSGTLCPDNEPFVGRFYSTEGIELLPRPAQTGASTDPLEQGTVTKTVNEKADHQRAARSVKQLPESLSPMYRSRVSKLSPTYRSHNVKHEPELHKPKSHT
jgi:hypothetical protein